MSGVLVVGNGPAAHRLAERLRHHGHRGVITLLGAERQPAYNRVLLTSVLARTLPAEAITLPSLPADIRVRLGVTATRIDRARRMVHADDDRAYRYDELVLATGAQPRTPDLPGLTTADGGLSDGVRTLRTVSDCEWITDGRVVVFGGGILGVEVVLALRWSGRDVALVHPSPHIMDRHLDAAGGQMLVAHLESMGITVHIGRRVTGYQPGELLLDDGQVLSTNTLLVCTGVTPDADLARAAGLTVHRGVVIDDRLRTNDPHIYAVGDCAEHNGDVPGRITPAWEQAETLAKLLTGGDARYCGAKTVTRLKAPSIDVASLGSPVDVDESGVAGESVQLSDPAGGRYAKLVLHDDLIIGAVLVGFPQAIASIGQLYERNLPVPSNRLALLLGTAADHGTAVELPDDAVICACHNVTKNALVCAWRDGARGLAELATATRATAGCGSCTHEVHRIHVLLSSTMELDAVELDTVELDGAA